MKTQPKLFEVPPDRPSRQSRLTEFKNLHHIKTHYAACDVQPWIAVLVEEDDRDKDLFDIMAESCRLYDESGLIGYGKGELSAIRQVCEKNNIQCDL